MSYTDIKRYREQDLERSIRELEILADRNKERSHYLSEEAFKLGLKYAIRLIEETELLLAKAQKEVPFANPKEADREYRNQKNTLDVIKNRLIKRYEGTP